MHQRVEDQRINALRLRVDANSRIEIHRAALDDHDQRVGIGLARAGSQQKPKHKEDNSVTKNCSRTFFGEGSESLWFGFAATHTKSCPESPACLRRWPREYSTVRVARSDGRVRRRRLPLLPLTGDPFHP